jgi:hypothetical protein
MYEYGNPVTAPATEMLAADFANGSMTTRRESEMENYIMNIMRQLRKVWRLCVGILQTSVGHECPKPLDQFGHTSTNPGSVP